MGAYDSNRNFDLEKFKTDLDSLGVTYSEAVSELLIEIPNGKQIMVSKTTGEIREGVHKIAYNIICSMEGNTTYNIMKKINIH